MKNLILLLLIFFSINTFAEKHIELGNGYIVSITTENKHSFKIVKDAETVNSIVSSRFNNTMFDIEGVLHDSNYFDMKTETIYIYVEKVRLIKKKGKIRYRKLKK